MSKNICFLCQRNFTSSVLHMCKPIWLLLIKSNMKNRNKKPPKHNPQTHGQYLSENTQQEHTEKRGGCRYCWL